MQNWILASVTPLIVWCVLFVYLSQTNRRVAEAERRLRELESSTKEP
ncbi:MAG TPA: hypothetical protein DER07_08350 [Armatimonadetes bacterium]|nr:hypothetical protein [Armatimonadota bacterium]